jgi:hypothetical protein
MINVELEEVGGYMNSEECPVWKINCKEYYG